MSDSRSPTVEERLKEIERQLYVRGASGDVDSADVSWLIAELRLALSSLSEARRDSERVEWLGANYAKFAGASIVGTIERTSITWEVSKHEVIEAFPWDADERTVTVVGDWRAAIDAAMEDERQLLANALAASRSTEETSNG